MLDFLFAPQRLVVEADGDTHAATAERDRRRDLWLAERGYRVLQFSNGDIFGNLEGVLLTIAQALDAPPSPQPSPPGAGEGEMR